VQRVESREAFMELEKAMQVCVGHEVTLSDYIEFFRVGSHELIVGHDTEAQMPVKSPSNSPAGSLSGVLYYRGN
jgi:hypothetical protein